MNLRRFRAGTTLAALACSSLALTACNPVDYINSVTTVTGSSSLSSEWKALADRLISGFSSESSPATPKPAPTAPPLATIVGDTDRDGHVTDADLDNRERADFEAGAIFLANLDDDAARCTYEAETPRAELAACNDAADEVVDGDADALDLARLQVKAAAELTDAATASLDYDTAHARIFLLQEDGNWTPVTASTTLTAAQLRTGVTLGVEGLDVMRDRTAWDGRLTVTLTTTDDGSSTVDRVQLQQAPLRGHDHTEDLQTVLTLDDSFKDAAPFNARLEKALGDVELRRLPGMDVQWIQDGSEVFHSSMPGENGPQHMRMVMRVDQGEDGQNAMYQLRGRDVGVAEVNVTPGTSDPSAGGNLEFLPPTPAHPNGRTIIGVRQHPDLVAEDHGHDADDDHGHGTMDENSPTAEQLAFLAAQGYDDPLILDTSHLAVGHVDEIVHVLPADNAAGFKLLVADPGLGKKMLSDLIAEGHGDVQLVDYPNSPTTVSEATDEMMQRQHAVAIEVSDRNIATLKAETGLGEQDIIRYPAWYRMDLHDAYDPTKIYPMASFNPNAINGIVRDPHTYIAPKTLGPDINGTDVFADHLKRQMSEAGYEVIFIDDYDYLHRGTGEIHCGTNQFREMTPWYAE
ncbi:protein-arginine deiminase domain-containing protein [Corynebacterium sp. TAE3-ERU16]|uniref:protein-arginine deiminase domain-containing protein n=1 Tax=Corynebacterium sp. TAE3-ERU16 TaxID=2849493 RepID=UPI001C45265E|nr:protein-arginine deiminase domain-containing protein [Corynebacterium sp. TAE3-ERU16]MBV7292289.1 protein-arginine deiminase domain-containing protein [Corynebacterium sp. TAE3-ERU16]